MGWPHAGMRACKEASKRGGNPQRRLKTSVYTVRSTMRSSGCCQGCHPHVVASLVEHGAWRQQGAAWGFEGWHALGSRGAGSCMQDLAAAQRAHTAPPQPQQQRQRTVRVIHPALGRVEVELGAVGVLRHRLLRALCRGLRWPGPAAAGASRLRSRGQRGLSGAACRGQGGVRGQVGRCRGALWGGVGRRGR